MTTISSYMTSEHRKCDETFAEVESKAGDKDWEASKLLFEKFSKELLLHLDKEEKILFPKFEAATAMSGGPTQIMRMEHDQMRQMLAELSSALETKDLNGFAGASETLHMLIQQHNMKEEQILYRMAEEHLASEWPELEKEMEALAS